MSPDRSRRQSKRTRYDVVLVPSSDTGTAKRISGITVWQIVSGVGGVAALIVTAVILLLMYTPLGPLVPIPNPELENRYNRELLVINDRMNSLMEQLVELRAYNLRLRAALGEKIPASDSGYVARRPGTGRSSEVRTDVAQGTVQVTPPIGSGLYAAPARDQIARGPNGRVPFPVIFPTDGYITRGYDPSNRHYGLDIAGKRGTIVNAAADGNVVFAGWTIEYGHMVIISHAGGYLTFYKHNQSLLTSPHSYVKRGEPIALLGDSGITSAGPHLHFEIWKDGFPVDPSQYLLTVNF